MNYPLIKVEDKELQQFESNPFASSFTQEVSTYAENCNNNDTIFEEYFAMDTVNIRLNVFNSSKSSLYMFILLE